MSEPPQDAERAQLMLREGLRVFGRYTLTKLVGEGGMGVVWSAHDETLGRAVALKFLPDHVRRDPEAVRDLKRETNRSLALTHENIVRVYTFEEDKHAAAIVMEYVTGRSLSSLKAVRPGGCFDVVDLAPLVTQVCAALDYAHIKAKVVHRDLKPGNLLVTDAGILKVVDFGIARSFQDTETRLTAVMESATGTLSYMSPQQLTGSKDVPAHDVYSLGATLYDLLTGKAPFYKGDIVGQIHAAAPAPMNERRAELENTGAPIPVEWETAIFACLDKDAARRPPTAGAVAQLLGLQYVALRTSSPFDTQATEATAATARFPLAANAPPPGEGRTAASTPPMSGNAAAPGTAGKPSTSQPASGKRGKLPLVAGIAAAVVVVGLIGFFAVRNSRAPAPAPAEGSAPGATASSAAEAGTAAGGNTGGKAAPVEKKPATFRDFVTQAKINTVIAGPPARAVINGKVVKAGETVDVALGIVFEKIEPEQHTIFFKDKAGAVATRKY